MKAILKLFLVIALFVILYNAVEEPVRAKFDNGFEEQMITLKEMRNNIYLVAWEFLGAYESEVANQRKTWDSEIALRRRKLGEKRGETERMPAFQSSSKYEKFMTK